MQHQITLLKKSWTLLKPFHKWFYIKVLIAFMLSGISVYLTFLGSKILTYVGNSQTQKIVVVFISLFVLEIIWNILNYFSGLLEMRKLGQDISQYLQEHSLRKILSLTTEQHIEDHSSIKQLIIVQGESAVNYVIKAVVSDFIPNLSYLIIAIIALTLHSVTIGLVCLVFCTILSLWVLRFTNFFRPYIQKNRDNWIEQGKTRTEAFTHLQLIKTLSRENYFIKKYINQRKEYAEYDIHVGTLNLNHKTKRSIFISSSDNLVFIFAVFLALYGSLGIGGIFLVWSLTSRVFWSITGLSNSLRDMPLRIVEIEKYFSATEIKPLFSEKGLTNTELTSPITFNSVTFKYRKSEQDVLHQVSFTIPNKKVTAFVGSSGSGKSTITKLLLRSYNYTDGTINIGETDLHKIDATYLREKIGYVEQHVDLLDDTIRENILFSVPEKDRKEAEERLEEVAEHARITEFYHRLGEKKFDTIVGERGIKLSGGERQRVGIARAIIKNPDILIFDEATSSLDTENEAKVMEAIKEVSEGKTTIIIAHRLSTVRDADKIIVMDKGRVVGEGTHDELLANNEYYQNLVAHQV
jgi:ABC-type multidrug transport system fused ATPase/permease subunit